MRYIKNTSLVLGVLFALPLAFSALIYVYSGASLMGAPQLEAAFLGVIVSSVAAMIAAFAEDMR